MTTILGFPGGSVVKNLPAVQETRFQSLGWEDPLEKEVATRSSILAWKIPWTEKPGGLQSMGLQRVGHDLATKEQQQTTIYEHLLCALHQLFYLIHNRAMRNLWILIFIFGLFFLSFSLCSWAKHLRSLLYFPQEYDGDNIFTPSISWGCLED